MLLLEIKEEYFERILYTTDT